MNIPIDEYKVTVFFNQPLNNSGEYQQRVHLRTSSEIKALIISRELFKNMDYDYMSIVEMSRITSCIPIVSLWEARMINELKE